MPYGMSGGMSAKIKRALQPLVDNHSLAGAVTLVASKDKILDVTAVGLADIAEQRPMRKNSLFWIASMTKPMTATALMMLVDEGKLRPDDPVEKYLPEFKGQMVVAEKSEDRVVLKKPAHPITVKNALSHTSGMPFTSPVEAPTMDALPLDTRTRSYGAMNLQFEPDTQYAYCNAGTNTCGRLIEVLSGQKYEDFMDERLLKPLGMTETSFWPSKSQLKRLAKPYKPNEAKTDIEETRIAQLRYPLSDRTRESMPAGGLFSTAPDTARFCQMILNRGQLDGRRYLSEPAVAEMTSRHTALHIKDSYGYCWSVVEDGCGHGGALNTNMIIDWKRELAFVYLVQHAGFIGDGAQGFQAFHQAALKSFA